MMCSLKNAFLYSRVDLMDCELSGKGKASDSSKFQTLLFCFMPRPLLKYDIDCNVFQLIVAFAKGAYSNILSYSSLTKI